MADTAPQSPFKREHDWPRIIAVSRELLRVLRQASATLPPKPAESRADSLQFSAVSHQVGNIWTGIYHLLTIDPRTEDCHCPNDDATADMLWLCYKEHHELRAAALRLWKFFSRTITPRLNEFGQWPTYNDAELSEFDAAIDAVENATDARSLETITIVPTLNEIRAMIQSTREKARHPTPYLGPNRAGADAHNNYATIVRMCEKCSIQAPPLPNVNFHPNQTINYVLNALDDVELALNRKTAKIERSAREYLSDKFGHIPATLKAISERLSNPPDFSEAFAEVFGASDQPDDESTGINRAQEKPKRSTERSGDEDQATYRLLNLFTGGLSDERFDQAAAVLRDGNLKTNEKLVKIDAIIPLPATASAEQLGRMLDVTKQAVLKTDWWIQCRKGEKTSEIGRRHDQHKKRAGQHESIGPTDEDG